MLSIDAPRYVSQQADGFNVTIERGDSGGHPDPVDSPLSVVFSASISPATSGGQPTTWSASAAGAVTPVNESVTFPAGVTTETVRIPVNPGAATPARSPSR
jgi:hypothetical protein